MDKIQKVVMLAVNSADFLRAEKPCQNACKKHPSSTELWFLLGVIHGQLGDCNRDGLGIEVDFSLLVKRVIRTLGRIIE